MLSSQPTANPCSCTFERLFSPDLRLTLLPASYYLCYSYQVAASAVCFIASPPSLYVGLDSGVLWSYSVSNNYADISPTTAPYPLHTARVVALAHAAKQRLLLSISKDKHLAVVDLELNKQRFSVAVGHTGMNAAQAGLASLVYDDEEEKVFVGTAANFVYIYTLPPDSPPLLLHALHGHTAPVTALHYHARDHLLFSGSTDFRVGVWAIQPGNSAAEASRSHLSTMMQLGPSKQIKALVYCPALREVVTGTEGGWLCVWNTEGGRIRYAWKGHGDSVSGMWWKDDEKVLVSSGLDGKVRFWSMRDTQLTLGADAPPTAGHATTEDGHRQQKGASDQQHSLSLQSEQQADGSQAAADAADLASPNHLTSTLTSIEPLPADADIDSSPSSAVVQANHIVQVPEPAVETTRSTSAALSPIDEVGDVASTEEPSLF